ncbi:MAG: hypothetical protein WC422_00080 [Candidatus Paceibacterota bacterium]|jgi:hypothetical protein
MGKKNTEELDNIEIIGDSGDDLADVKRQLKKLKKESEDSDEEDSDIGTIEDDDADVEAAVSEDIVINEDNSLPFNEEERYYKSLEKFLKDDDNK